MTSYVVTGASRGIGLAFVHRLSAANLRNNVYALARRPDAEGAPGLLEFAKDAKNVHIVQCDLDDHKSIRKAAEEVGKLSGGSIDVLLNNGALLYHERNYSTLEQYPDDETVEADMLTFFKTNVIGVTHTITAFLPLLRAPSPSSSPSKPALKKIIILSSVLAALPWTIESGQATLFPYSVSKAAANMVTAKFAAMLKRTNVRDAENGEEVGNRNENENEFVVASVTPAVVKTKMPDNAQTDAEYDAVVAFCRQFNPIFKGAISTAEAVTDIMNVVDALTPADSGKFLHSTGEDGNGFEF